MVLTIDCESADGRGELAVYGCDYEKQEVVVHRKPVTLKHDGVASTLMWDGVEHTISRTRYTDERGREQDLIRVKGLGRDERGQAFLLSTEEQIQNGIERLEYEAVLYGRLKHGLKVGPHLLPKFQNLYYGFDATESVLSLFVHGLTDNERALLDRYRVRPFGAVWNSRDELEASQLPVTIVARDDDAVIVYCAVGPNEGFHLGTLTDDRDDNDDQIVRDRERKGSEIGTLQIALQRTWNP